MISRPSAPAATAARASCSAVDAPAETPRTVALVRIVPGISGARLSTTATTMTRAVSGSMSIAALVISGNSQQAAADRCLAGVAHAVRRVAVAAVFCCGPTTSDVGMFCEAAKAASCGPRARAPGSEERDSTRSEE